MSRIARYGRATALDGKGAELGRRLLAAGEELRADPGCELYLVSHEKGAPDTVWVTELWRSQADLDRSIEVIRGSDDVAAVLALVERFEMVELDLLGGKGP